MKLVDSAPDISTSAHPDNAILIHREPAQPLHQLTRTGHGVLLGDRSRAKNAGLAFRHRPARQSPQPKGASASERLPTP